MSQANWNLSLPPGFECPDPSKPITKYARRLPHWRQSGATYFVSFRLADSLPQAKLDELKAWRDTWLKKDLTEQELNEFHRETVQKIETWLDQGMGSCHLNRPDLSKIVADAMHHFDGQRYLLGSFVVMPNHVHAIVRPWLDEVNSLEKILQSWKRHSSREINQVLGVFGNFWEEESFDRIIRKEEHLYRAVQYIGNNPAKAGLKPNTYLRWRRPDWIQSGWQFDRSS